MRVLPKFGLFSDGYKYVTIAGHICKLSKNEVTIIRRALSLLTAFVLLSTLVYLIPEAEAASLSSRAGAVTVSSGYLNVRTSPSSSASKAASLQKGSYLTLMEKSGSWWRVEYAKGKFGYCHADYITLVAGTPTTVATNSGGLNVRSGPGTSYAKVGTVYKGEVVIVLSSASGWSRILYNGTKTGYVSTQYLSQQYPAVSLWVPNLKQMDSRWGSLTLAESGKTFAQIGCATTAIAMMESHRTGKTIYPNVMAESLRYTPSGSVYWPDHYSVVTEGSGYLNVIYTRLGQGKPVLFGARNDYGSQHWVVITGYTGGNTLSASGFIINDPGSYSRTNLQQLLDLYPNFYKFFYY